MDPAARLRSQSRGAGAELESIEVRTVDRWSLRADVWEPTHASVPRAPLVGAGRRGGDGAAIGVAVLAHALMARRGAFDRPKGAGFAPFLAARGWCVVAFDFRGHGESRPPDAASATSFGYDDLVARDLPAVFDFAGWRAREGLPVVAIGHSLGGHVTLAALATNAVRADAAVALGAAPWIPELEPSMRRWWLKRAIVTAMLAVARRSGRFPARALRLGSDDEPQTFVADLERFARTGRWASAEGVDYLGALSRLHIPVLSVVSEGDRLECRPACGVRLATRLGASSDVLRVTCGDEDSRAPDHMGILTNGRARSTWARMEEWMRAKTCRC